MPRGHLSNVATNSQSSSNILKYVFNITSTNRQKKSLLIMKEKN